MLPYGERSLAASKHAAKILPDRHPGDDSIWLLLSVRERVLTVKQE